MVVQQLMAPALLALPPSSAAVVEAGEETVPLVELVNRERMALLAVVAAVVAAQTAQVRLTVPEVMVVLASFVLRSTDNALRRCGKSIRNRDQYYHCRSRH
jgi:hypothetical protein